MVIQINFYSNTSNSIYFFIIEQRDEKSLNPERVKRIYVLNNIKKSKQSLLDFFKDIMEHNGMKIQT